MALEITRFGALPDGREVKRYTLSNASGLSLSLTDYGCRVLSLLAPDRDGRLGDVVLGHRTLEEYFGANYQGAFVGRYANRIGGAAFTLNGQTRTLDKNDGENSLHGGPGGFHQVLFAAEARDGDAPSVTFTHLSPDGDEGFPGALKITVRYTLTAEGAVRVEYTGEADRETVFNPTNHSFFNLSGDPQREVLDTQLSINAGRVTAVADDLIPTGELLDVTGGPLDFRQAKPLGQDMFADDHLIQLCGGFDHNFCVDGEPFAFRPMARAWEPESGRVMEVFSDLPGIQLYTFNRTSGLYGKDGAEMRPHSAFCLETQFYPDSPNHPAFPFRTVKPGEAFRSATEYRFSVK